MRVSPVARVMELNLERPCLFMKCIRSHAIKCFKSQLYLLFIISMSISRSVKSEINTTYLTQNILHFWYSIVYILITLYVILVISSVNTPQILKYLKIRDPTGTYRHVYRVVGSRPQISSKYCQVISSSNVNTIIYNVVTTDYYNSQLQALCSCVHRY